MSNRILLHEIETQTNNLKHVNNFLDKYLNVLS